MRFLSTITKIIELWKKEKDNSYQKLAIFLDNLSDIAQELADEIGKNNKSIAETFQNDSISIDKIGRLCFVIEDLYKEVSTNSVIINDNELREEVLLYLGILETPRGYYRTVRGQLDVMANCPQLLDRKEPYNRYYETITERLYKEASSLKALAIKYRADPNFMKH